MKNPKISENLLKTEWLKEIKEDGFKILETSRLLKQQIKFKKYYVKDKYTML